MAGPSSVPVFERFFRSVAQLKVDKSDVKRFREFVDEMVDGIAIAGRNSARWNDRDVIAPMDLPITKGLQERMREFDKLDEAVNIRQRWEDLKSCVERFVRGCEAGFYVQPGAKKKP